MKIRVKAVGELLVPDYAAFAAGIVRFVGRRHDPNAGPNGGWVPLEEPVEIECCAELVQEVQAGALEPCDAETARRCGVVVH